MAGAPRELIHNFRLKLSALGLAVFLWALVQTPLSQEVALGVPPEAIFETTLQGFVVHVDASPGEADVVASPASIRLRLAGAGTSVMAVDLSLLRVSVSPESLRDMEPGEARLVPIQVDGVPALVTAVPVPEAVTVTRASDQPDGEEENRP